MNPAEAAIKSKTVYHETLTAYANQLHSRSNKSKLELFSTIRAFDIDTVNKERIFYIGEQVEMLLPEYFDKVKDLGVISENNMKPIFHNRWVLPIKDTSGLVQNFVGYSPYADERYIYGTSKYYRRRSTLYGLENLHYAYELGYAILTEGITDSIRMKDIGYRNSFAMCGTHFSITVQNQLNRLRHGVILIPDRDDAGLRAHKQWQFNRSITIIPSLLYKDIDEMCTAFDSETSVKTRNEQNISYLQSAIEHSIAWLKSGEHRGLETERRVITLQ